MSTHNLCFEQKYEKKYQKFYWKTFSFFFVVKFSMNLNRHVYIMKSRVCNSSNKNWSEFCDLYAYAQPIFLLCCKYQIILKTVEVAETQTLLCHVYKAILSKSKVCNSSNKKLIRFLRLLYTCPAYILTLLQVSNHLENCRRTCRDMHPTMP